jgi:hypothetical protein
VTLPGTNRSEIGNQMNKSRPFELLSVRFRISRESAKYFLTRVQKSFTKEKPTHQLILEFLEENKFEALPRPYEVARLMNEAGVWTDALQPEPSVPLNEEDLYVE